VGPVSGRCGISTMKGINLNHKGTNVSCAQHRQAQAVSVLLTGIIQPKASGRLPNKEPASGRLFGLTGMLWTGTYFLGGFGQFAWLPLPSFAPLPGAVSLPDPSRNGVPVEFGLPRLFTDLPEPS